MLYTGLGPVLCYSIVSAMTIQWLTSLCEDGFGNSFNEEHRIFLIRLTSRIQKFQVF